MDMTTTQHADAIAESWINGQRKQALQQFMHALREECNVKSLLADLRDCLTEEQTIDFMAQLITKLTEEGTPCTTQ